MSFLVFDSIWSDRVDSHSDGSHKLVGTGDETTEMLGRALGLIERSEKREGADTVTFAVKKRRN